MLRCQLSCSRLLAPQVIALLHKGRKREEPRTLVYRSCCQGAHAFYKYFQWTWWGKDLVRKHARNPADFPGLHAELSTWGLQCTLSIKNISQLSKNQSIYQLQSNSCIIWGMWEAENATVGVSLRCSLQVSKAGVSWREPGRVPDSWLFLKRISEMDYCLNPFFQWVPTNCHFSFCFTIASENTDR